jgi:hypothetical protein
MAKLGTYFGTHAGTLKIYVGFFEVGSGTFSVFNDAEVDFAGSYQTFAQSGTFAIRIRLTDNDPAAISGSCEVTLNEDVDDAAKYEVHGAKLTVATTLNPTPVRVYRNQGGTQIDGVSGHDLWIGQSAIA